MHHKIVLIILAVVIILMFCYTISREKFVYKSDSRDCDKFPDDPACKPECTTDSDCPSGFVCLNGICGKPSSTGLESCAPADGRWSIPHQDQEGRSKLTSPCCQPPNYDLAKNYSTCDNVEDASPAVKACMQNCCAFAQDQARFYDDSWFPMARCGCSLWCHNKTVPHFSKWGTAQHYITGDIAEARTSDSPNFIDFTNGVAYQTFRHRH